MELQEKIQLILEHMNKLDKLDILDNMLEKLINLDEKMLNLEKKLKDCEDENIKLKATVEKQKQAINDLDRSIRKRNVVIHGLDVDDKDPGKGVVELFQKVVGADVSSADIDECVQMNNKVIKVSFSSRMKKEAVMAMKHKLRNHKNAKIFVNHDLPYDTRQELKKKRNEESRTRSQEIVKELEDPTTRRKPPCTTNQETLTRSIQPHERFPRKSKYRKGKNGARIAPPGRRK